MDVTEEGLYFSFENGFQHSKPQIKNFLKFMLDLTIESTQFLIQSNRLLNQSDCQSLKFEEGKFSKFFKMLELAQKNIKTEIKNSMKGLMSTVNMTKLPDYKKHEILGFLKENWQDALNSDYRVTINRRDKLYEMLNILEGDFDGKSSFRTLPNPNFYADKSETDLNLTASIINSQDNKPSGSNGFNAQSVEHNEFLGIKNGKKTVLENFPKSSPPRSELKTNLLNLDTSRDNLLSFNNMSFNPQAAQIRSMAFEQDNKENYAYGNFKRKQIEQDIYNQTKDGIRVNNFLMSKISGLKDPLRSKITNDFDGYSLSDVREEEEDSFGAFQKKHAQKYTLPDLDTSSNRYSKRGFNQYLYHNEQITERSHEYLSTLNDSTYDQRYSNEKDNDSLIKSYRTEDMKQTAGINNFSRLSRDEDIMVSDLDRDDKIRIMEHGSNSIQFIGKRSIDTVGNKSKTIESLYANLEKGDQHSTLQSQEQEKLILYVGAKFNKKKEKELERELRKSGKDKDRNKSKKSKLDQRGNSKDTSTERKTRILTKTELEKKRNKLTFELTKPVQILVYGQDSTFQGSTEQTINAEHLVSRKNQRNHHHQQLNESTNSELMDQSFMMDHSPSKGNKMKESSMLKLNESSILSANPYFKTNLNMSDIKADESILNKILPDQFLASMNQEDLMNFNTLTSQEKGKKLHEMMMRRKSSKSLSISHKKSPQSQESKKMMLTTTSIVYQPNILSIPGNGYKQSPSPSRLSHMSNTSAYNPNQSNMKDSKVLTGLSSAKKSDPGFIYNPGFSPTQSNYMRMSNHSPMRQSQASINMFNSQALSLHNNTFGMQNSGHRSANVNQIQHTSGAFGSPSVKNYMNNSFGLVSNQEHNFQNLKAVSPRRSSTKKNSPLQRTFGSPNQMMSNIEINDFNDRKSETSNSPVPSFIVNQSIVSNQDNLNPFFIEKPENEIKDSHGEIDMPLPTKVDPPMINPRELFKIKNQSDSGFVYESERNREIQGSAKEFFSQFIVEEHQLSDPAVCLDCCISADNLYVGGKNLQIFERGQNMYKSLGISQVNGDKERFIKVYPDGRFVVRDLKTNSLILFSPNFKELSCLQGEVYYDLTQSSFEKIRNFENSSGNMVLLWRKSKHTIAIVNLKDFKVKKEISNFWTYKDFELNDCLAICDSSMMNIIGVSELPDKSRIFHHYTKEGKVVNAQMNTLMPDLNLWHCMTMCQDKSKFFVSGTSSFNLETGILFAIFESTVPIKIVTAIKVPKVQTTQKVQRICGSDVFVVACESDIMVAQYQPATSKLELINKIKALGETPIVDLCFRKYFCYVVLQDSTKLMILNFKPGRQKSPKKYMQFKDEPEEVNQFGAFQMTDTPVKLFNSRYSKLGLKKYESQNDVQVQKQIVQPPENKKIEFKQIQDQQTNNTSKLTIGNDFSLNDGESVSFQNQSFSDQQRNSDFSIGGSVAQNDSPPTPTLGELVLETKSSLETPRGAREVNVSPNTPPSNGPKVLKSVTKSNKKTRERNQNTNGRRNIQRVKVDTEHEISPRKVPDTQQVGQDMQKTSENTSRAETNLQTISTHLKTPSVPNLQIQQHINNQNQYSQPNTPYPTKANSVISETLSYNQLQNAKNHETQSTPVNNNLNNSIASLMTNQDNFQQDNMSRERSSVNETVRIAPSPNNNADIIGREITRRNSEMAYPVNFQRGSVHSLPTLANQSMERLDQSMQENAQLMQKNSSHQLPPLAMGSLFKPNNNELLSPHSYLNVNNLGTPNNHFSHQSSNYNLEQTHGTLRSLNEGSNSQMINFENTMQLSVASPGMMNSTMRHERKITEIAIPANMNSELNRINISNNEKYIFVGGQNLHFLKKIIDQYSGKITYALLSNKSIDVKYYNLIPTPSGHFLVFEQNSNNAILFNKNFEQVKKFLGSADKITPPITIQQCKRNYCNVKSGEIIWISGQDTIHSVQMANLELEQIKIFDDQFIEQMEPYILQAVYTTKHDLVVVCYLKEDLAIAYQKKGKLETDIHYLNDIIPESNPSKFDYFNFQFLVDLIS